MIPTENPITLAQEMARLLESDLVATAQIKEHITEERLCEILRIEPPESEDEGHRFPPEEAEIDELKDYLTHFTRAQVLAALRG